LQCASAKHVSILTFCSQQQNTTFKMRLFFLIAFFIASTSAFAPLANTRRSHSVLAPFQAAKVSPVKAADKAVLPGKKQPTKASPPKGGAAVQG
jgi:hypothetical protein